MEENEIEKANKELAMLKDEGIKSLQKDKHNALKRALKEYDSMLIRRSEL